MAPLRTACSSSLRSSRVFSDMMPPASSSLLLLLLFDSLLTDAAVVVVEVEVVVEGKRTAQ